jgi:hypothetical protein
VSKILAYNGLQKDSLRFLADFHAQASAQQAA